MCLLRTLIKWHTLWTVCVSNSALYTPTAASGSTAYLKRIYYQKTNIMMQCIDIILIINNCEHSRFEGKTCDLVVDYCRLARIVFHICVLVDFLDILIRQLSLGLNLISNLRISLFTNNIDEDEKNIILTLPQNS